MGCGHFVSGITIFVQVALAVAVVAVTALKLAPDSATVSHTSTSLSVEVSTTSECLLGTVASGISACDAAYLWSSVSIAATIVLGLATCLTCNLCGVGFVLDLLFSLVGVAWWAVGAVALTRAANAPAVSDYPQREARVSVVAMAWALLAMFAVTLGVSVARMCSKCCCGGRRDGDARGSGTGTVDAHVVIVPAQQAPSKQQQFVRGSDDALAFGNTPYWTTTTSGVRA